ncbi:Arc family DNA-binding protein [Acinetobacter sp. WCHAc010052]|nr:Arc family DNA-binding protein [Acinetobacter sp. WCHAc010052]
MGKNLADVEYKMRMTQDLKDKIVESAKEHNRSMNADIIARLEDSFLKKDSSVPARSDVKILHLKNGKKRVIYGKLVNNLSLDYTQELDQLRDDIHLALEVLSDSSFWNSLKFLGKDVLVYKGDNHIDVVDNGEGSLGWLTVEDHITDKYMENLYRKSEEN